MIRVSWGDWVACHRQTRPVKQSSGFGLAQNWDLLVRKGDFIGPQIVIATIHLHISPCLLVQPTFMLIKICKFPMFCL